MTELQGLAEAPTYSTKGPQFTASPVFKEWKHRLIDLLQRIEAQGYEVNCGVRTRHFSPLVYPMALGPTGKNQRDSEAFFDAVNQTLLELRTIIENFERYGTPPKKRGREGATPNLVDEPSMPKVSPVLADPQKVTLVWLWQHVPVSMWAAAAALLGASAVAGYAFASTNLGKSVKQWFEPAPETAPSLPNRPASSPPR